MRLGFLGRGDAMTEVTARGSASVRGHVGGLHSGLKSIHYLKFYCFD